MKQSKDAKATAAAGAVAATAVSVGCAMPANPEATCSYARARRDRTKNLIAESGAALCAVGAGVARVCTRWTASARAGAAGAVVATAGSIAVAAVANRSTAFAGNIIAAVAATAFIVGEAGVAIRAARTAGADE